MADKGTEKGAPAGRGTAWYVPVLAFWLLVSAVSAEIGRRGFTNPGATPFDLSDSPFITVYAFMLLLTGFAGLMGVLAGRQAGRYVDSPYAGTRQWVENSYGMVGISAGAFLVLAMVLLP